MDNCCYLGRIGSTAAKPDANSSLALLNEAVLVQDWIMQQLETIFGELGITQYLSSFVDQGFDSWDTVLDITETDL